MKPKEFRRDLKRHSYRPTKSAYRLMKRFPDTWRQHPDLYVHKLPSGVRLVFTRKELEQLQRRENTKKFLRDAEASRRGRRRELARAAIFTLLVGLPALILVLGTLISIYGVLLP